METTDKDVSGTGRRPRKHLDVSNQLWKNNTIWSEISSYLSIADLKELSCVNKLFLERVRSLSRFTFLAGQKVTGRMEIHVFKLSRAIVEVNKLNPIILKELASKIFQETEHLELQSVDDLVYAERNSRLIEIVSNCPKLKSLTFGKLNYLGSDYRSFFRNEKVKLILANLKELQIGKTTRDFKTEHEVRFHPRNFAKRDSTIGRLLTYHLISELQMKFVKFNYSETTVLKECFVPAKLLSTSRKTLRELNLTIDFQGLAELRNMLFPRLAKLDLAVIQWPENRSPPAQFSIHKFEQYFIPFLNGHLCLSGFTELQFSSNYGYNLAPFCRALRDSSCGKKLEVLAFKTQSGFTGSFSTIDWHFLSTMSNLRDFKLAIMKQFQFYSDDDDMVCIDDFSEVLYNLPSSVKSIEFRGFEFKGQSDSDSDLLINTKSSLLLRLVNLTELRIHCGYFFDDKLLQFICEDLVKLRILAGDFTRVTSYGISGVLERENIDTGISISNLKGLTELEINSCEDSLTINLTDVLRSVRFTELRKLTVKSGNKVETIRIFPEDKLLQLLSQNPSLERIEMWKLMPLNDVRVKLLQLYPRLKLERADTFPFLQPCFIRPL